MVTSWGMIPELLSQGKGRGHSVNCKTFEMHLTLFQIMDLRREKLEHAMHLTLFQMMDLRREKLEHAKRRT